MLWPCTAQKETLGLSNLMHLYGWFFLIGILHFIASLNHTHNCMIAIYRFSNKQDKLFKIQIRIQNCTELSLSSCILPLQFTLMAIWMKNYREMSISTSDSKFKIKSHNYLYLLSRPNSFLLSDQQVSSWPILWLGISTLGPIFRVARIFHTHHLVYVAV